MQRRASGLVFAALAFAAAAGTAAAAPDGREDAGPLVVEVRVFEIRRLNSDFSPIEDLSFGVDSDGTSVQVSEWLATLARRIPDAYFAQLLTFGPAPAAAEAKWEIRRQDGRRAIRMRVRPAPADAPASGPVSGVDPPEANGPPGRFRLDFDLLRTGTAAQEIRLQGPIEPGMTRMVSGLNFEIPLSRYLSWFREPGDLAARGNSSTRVSGIGTSIWRSGSLSGASKVRLRRRPSGSGRRTILGSGSSGRRWLGTRKASCASASTWTKKAP